MNINSLIKNIFEKFGDRSKELGVGKLHTPHSQLPTRKEVQQPKESQQLQEINLALQKTSERLAKLEADLNKATAGYRSMLVSQNPEVLPELIRGESIEELDKSLATAKELTEKVRQQIEKKAAAERIPGGAPARTAPNAENMNAHEKIVYGLGGK
jgi:hypothetical protein